MQGVTALLIGLVGRAGFASGVATPLAPLRVTVRELARHNNTLEIEPGTEVIWADVHFDAYGICTRFCVGYARSLFDPGSSPEDGAALHIGTPGHGSTIPQGHCDHLQL